MGAIADSQAGCYGCPFQAGWPKTAYSMLISWLRAQVFYTQLAGQELCLFHVDRLAEGYGSSHSTDQPRTVLSPIHIDKLNSCRTHY